MQQACSDASRWEPALKAKFVRIAAACIALTLVIGGGVAATLHRSVTVIADGESRTVSGFFFTVSDALGAAGITTGEHDSVTPSLTSAVDNGLTIDVRYGRPLAVALDGTTTTYWTTETTLANALSALSLRFDSSSRLSEATSRSLGRDGLALTVTTPKAITLTVAGQTTQLTTTAPTVADLLADQSLTVGELDRLTPSRTTPITAGATVKLDRVEVKEVTRAEAIAFTTTKQDDPSLLKGITKTVTKGVDGAKSVTEKQTIVNGVVETADVLASTVTKEPVNAVVQVGTQAPPAGSTTGSTEINLANAAMWDRIAQCESGGRWNINTGNGYYGGLQFSYQTWLGVGGADFAARADLASREQQITVANRLYAKSGLQPWGCRGAA